MINSRLHNATPQTYTLAIASGLYELRDIITLQQAQYDNKEVSFDHKSNTKILTNQFGVWLGW